MHVSENSCPLTSEAEFEFWGLEEIFLQPCCALKYFPRTVSAHIEKHEDSFDDDLSDFLDLSNIENTIRTCHEHE